MLPILASLAFASVHEDHQREFGTSEVPYRPPRPALLPAVTPGPDRIVYGYEAYWNADLNAVPWDHISHLAIFSAEATTSGGLTNAARFDRAADAVQIAAPYGVKVHLCVTNFNTSELTTLLGSESARTTLINNIVAQVERTGAHGVNIDFEGLPASRRQQMITFVQDLDARVDEVVLATPAVDWSGAWDYSELSEHAMLFIMGYGYYWGGSSTAGPTDPLYGGGGWGTYSLDWTVRDYLTNEADPSKVILGLPLYGMRWSTASGDVRAAATGTGSSIVFSTAWTEMATHGARYDTQSHTPWWYDGSRQGWAGNADSVRDRIEYADNAGIAGFGFWALHYTGSDSSGVWNMIDEETSIEIDDTDTDDTGDSDPDTDTDTGGDPEGGGFVADAGRPFLAYPGDTVVLSAEWSSGPGELAYRWTQASGPDARLDATDVVSPSFVPTVPGTYAFDVEVGDGDTFPASDRTYVVVLDRGVGAAYRSCGTLPGPSALGVGVIALLAVGRRVTSGRARRGPGGSSR
jgi:spore germination protein YaaH